MSATSSRRKTGRQACSACSRARTASCSSAGTSSPAHARMQTRSEDTRHACRSRSFTPPPNPHCVFTQRTRPADPGKADILLQSTERRHKSARAHAEGPATRGIARHRHRQPVRHNQQVRRGAIAPTPCRHRLGACVCYGVTVCVTVCDVSRAAWGSGQALRLLTCRG
jgi:hypothetical protein